MLVKPDDVTNQALARFAESAEFKVIEMWLQKGRENCIAASLNPDAAKSRQAQGSFMVIDQLLELTQKAQALSRR